MKCVAYMRVSTEKQVEEGNGLDSQKRDILDYANKNDIIIRDWYIDDGYTGTNMDRPALQRLISDCYSKKVDTVISFKMDRLSRGMVDGLYIIEKIFVPNDVKFICVHDAVNYDSPMEQAYTQMMAVFAQLDKNTMMLRMRGGMLERIKQGYWMGGGNLPYCYSYDKEKGILIPIPERKELANKAIRLFIDGWSDERIMNTLGFRNEATVKSILTSVVNIGKIPYKGEIYHGLHEPIFDEETFNLAQKARESRRKNKTSNNQYLLSGLCECGVCGNAMRYQKWADGSYHKIYCYSRNSNMKRLPKYNSNCNNEIFFASDIEKEVEKQILEISLNLKLSDLDKQNENKSQILEKQLESIRNKLKRLYVIYSDGDDTVLDVIDELKKDEKDLKSQIEILKSEEINVPSIENTYKEIKKIADVWEHINNQSKNNILKSIIDKIVICNDSIEIKLKNF